MNHSANFILSVGPKMPLGLLLLLMLSISFNSAGQQRGIISHFLSDSSRQSWYPHSQILNNEEKMQKINSITLSEPYQFVDYSSEEKEFFPVDTSGIYFIDLNFDSHPDLIYRDMPSYTQLASKFFINDSKVFNFNKLITGYALSISINKTQKSLSFSYHNPPCCDSYTHSISYYSMKNDEFILDKRVLFLDPQNRRLSFIPNFNPLDSVVLESDTELCFLNNEFRGHIWFGSREKTNEMNKLIRSDKLTPIPSGIVPTKTKVFILIRKNIDDETWLCVITEPIAPLKNSLFEKWQLRLPVKNQYLGWIKASN